MTILTPNQKCIVNTDLDGFLSALLLSHYLNWEVVGFCNSRDTMWIDQSKVQSLQEVVFIDMFVVNPLLKSIDQHIVSVNQNHLDLQKDIFSKLNPNIMRGRVLFGDTYYRKYPFGTFHFLVSQLEGLGFNVKKDLPLSKKILGEIRLIDVLLRADDTLNTTCFSYPKNAQDWWGWLGQGDCTRAFVKYCNAIKNKKIPYNIYQVKITLESHFKRTYGCDTGDGGYRSAKSFAEVSLKRKAKRYLKDLSDWCELPPISLSKNYTLYIGDRSVDEFSLSDLNYFLENSVYKGKEVFSYAFISAYGNEGNFSYTTNMRKC